jgi:hypothetical protein
MNISKKRPDNVLKKIRNKDKLNPKFAEGKMSR